MAYQAWNAPPGGVRLQLSSYQKTLFGLSGGNVTKSRKAEKLMAESEKRRPLFTDRGVAFFLRDSSTGQDVMLPLPADITLLVRMEVSRPQATFRAKVGRSTSGKAPYEGLYFLQNNFASEGVDWFAAESDEVAVLEGMVRVGQLLADAATASLQRVRGEQHHGKDTPPQL